MSTKKCLVILCLFAFGTASTHGSQIKRITLAELLAKADLIVMGEVTKVVAVGDRDNVTIQVDSYLKGESPQTVSVEGRHAAASQLFHPASSGKRTLTKRRSIRS